MDSKSIGICPNGEAAGMRSDDTLAEWLRRRPAKSMGFPRVGSNPTGVVLACSLTGAAHRCLCDFLAGAMNWDVASQRRRAPVV